MAENNAQNRSNAGVNKSFAEGQVTQRRQGNAAFLALNGVEVDEGYFVAQARVPSEDSIDIAVRRRDAEDSPVVRIRLEIVKRNGGRFRVRSAVYLVDKDGTTEIESLDRPDAEELLRRVRVLLHTNRQGLPSNGRIASLIDEAITQAVGEAKRRTREARAEAAEKLYEQALNEPGLRDDLLRYVIDTLGLVHAGDEIAKKVGVLAVASSRLPEPYRLSVLFIAPSGRGKTNLMRALEAVTPRAWRLFGAESLGSSPLALFYHAMENPGFVLEMRHKVWFVNEPSWLLLGQNEEDPGKRLMKQAISDVSDREPKCYDTVITINNTRKAIKLCLRGKPVIFATIQDKYSHMLDEQIISRMVPVMLDPSRVVLPDIIYHIVYVKTDTNTKLEFERRARLIRAYLARELPRVDVVEFTENAKAKIIQCSPPSEQSIERLCSGYIGELLGNLEVEPVVSRASEALKSLAASLALIRKRFEVRDNRVVLRVTAEDVDDAWEIAHPIIEAMVYAQNPLYQKVKGELLELLKSGPKQRKDIIEHLKGKFNISRAWIERLLTDLVRLGIIERCKKGIYALDCNVNQSITEYANSEEQNGQGGEE